MGMAMGAVFWVYRITVALRCIVAEDIQSPGMGESTGEIESDRSDSQQAWNSEIFCSANNTRNVGDSMRSVAR